MKTKPTRVINITTPIDIIDVYRLAISRIVTASQDNPLLRFKYAPLFDAVEEVGHAHHLHLSTIRKHTTSEWRVQAVKAYVRSIAIGVAAKEVGVCQCEPEAPWFDPYETLLDDVRVRVTALPYSYVFGHTFAKGDRVDHLYNNDFFRYLYSPPARRYQPEKYNNEPS